MIPQLLPWRRVKNWTCLGCGDCCTRFTVLISGKELAKFAWKYPWALQADGGKTVLKRTPTGCCVFQVGSHCGIQHDKPLACKLWPFRVMHRKPLRLEDSSEAEYAHQGQRYYVYIHRQCPGLGVGHPTELVLQESVRILEGSQPLQEYTTQPPRQIRKNRYVTNYT